MKPWLIVVSFILLAAGCGGGSDKKSVVSEPSDNTSGINSTPASDPISAQPPSTSILEELETLPLEYDESNIVPPYNLSFPSNAGVVNVKDFGAVGDGSTDDTAAILAAISPDNSMTGPYDSIGTMIDPTKPMRGVNRIVYFPKGTYLISDTLERRLHDRLSQHLGLGEEGRYINGLILIGESRDDTVLKLNPNVKGFDNPAAPKAVIFFASNLAEWRLKNLVNDRGDLINGATVDDVIATTTVAGKNYIDKGEAADGYENHLRNLTIDVGDHAGAIAVDFLANNGGGIDNVVLRSSSNGGYIGLNVARLTNGPDLVTNLIVDGFATGINAEYHSHGVVMEHVHLVRQRSVSIKNRHHPLTLRDIFIQPNGMALQSEGDQTLVVLVDAVFDGSISSQSIALDNSGYLHVRNLKCQNGFDCSVLGHSMDSWSGVFNPGNVRIDDADTPWSLPVKNTPTVNFEDVSQWANVLDYGADPSGVDDSTSAFQQAMTSGFSTVFIPYGTYNIHKNFDVPASVQRIFGAFARLNYSRSSNYTLDKTKGMFRATNSNSPLIIHDLYIDNEVDGAVIFDSVASASLVVKNITSIRNNNLIVRGRNGGEMFLENTTNFRYIFSGEAGVWARQLNTEGKNVRVTVEQSPAWFLGFKTENDCTLLENIGGKVEVLGGFTYPTLTNAPTLPAFINDNGNLLITLQETVPTGSIGYSEIVRNVKNGVIQSESESNWPVRAEQNGITVPVYSSSFISQ